MLKKTLYGMLVVVWIVSPLAAAEEDVPPGKWWRTPTLSEQLKLSDEEKQAMDDLFVNSRRKLIDLKSAVEKERFELENLLEKEPLNEAAVKEQAKKLEKARSNLANERFQYFLEVRKILGLERFQQLRGLFGESREGRRMGGKHMHRDRMGDMP